jgi:hypothetical protein
MESICLASVDETTRDLADLDRRTNEAAAESILTLARESEEAAPILAGVDRRIRTRGTKIERGTARVNRLTADLANLRTQLETYNREVLDLSATQSRMTQEANVRERKTTQLQECVRARPETELRGAATLLTGLSGQIEPGSLTYNVDDQALRWTTTDIQIRDGFGGYLPRNYGRFRITLSLDARVLSTGLFAEVVPLDSDRDYSHPHVSDSNPCLGTGQQVLLACMLERDYATAIATMTEFMEDYSDDNPYRALIDFGDLNRWAVPTCHTGKHLVSDCDCPRCVTCCRMGGTDQPIPVIIQDCGSCSTCCTQVHKQDIHAPANSGIPGSSCSVREG